MLIKMGFAQVDITPNTPVMSVGFGRTEPLRGVRDSLMAGVSVWDNGVERCCLAAIDHIGFGAQNAAELRDEIGAVIGAPRERVMLCFSHTHSAPNDSIEREYFEIARAKIVAAAAEANAGLTPVYMDSIVARVNIGLNRRGADGQLDSRAGAIVLARPGASAPCLIILRLTAHNNCLKSDNDYVSADYFGATRALFSEKFGCPVMVTQGAAGNIAPAYYHCSFEPIDASGGVNSPSAPEDMARAALAGLEGAISAANPREIHKLDMYARHISLTADVPDIETARGVAREALENCGVDGAGWLSEVARLNAAGVKFQAERIEVQYFRAGDICLCGVPNEIMCEFALAAAARLGEKFFLSGYTNGCSGYFPTEAEFDEGGYEVYWSLLSYYIYHGRVYPLRRESASRLVDFAVDCAPADFRNVDINA